MRFFIRLSLTVLFALLVGPLMAGGVALVEGFNSYVGSILTLWKRLK